ncbi:MAG: hypothetical protein CMJ52_02275 [Planctomycetaceae bacterium]|nr:hypothetical protein [Planctomycetaceae bacterium]
MRPSSLLLLFAFMLTGGCVGPGGAATAPSETNQQAIKLLLLDADGEDQRYALYRWRADGRFFYGGGRDAHEGETPIELPFPEDVRRTLTKVIEDVGWLAADFKPSAASEGPRLLEVDLRLRGVRRKFELKADGRRFDRGTTEVLEALQAISGQRFRGVLDGLPQADAPSR